MIASCSSADWAFDHWLSGNPNIKIYTQNVLEYLKPIQSSKKKEDCEKTLTSSINTSPAAMAPSVPVAGKSDEGASVTCVPESSSWSFSF
jgi:hypothetical protein